MQRASELTGNPVIQEFMGQQSGLDYSTCAYHVLQWVSNIININNVQKVKLIHKYKVEGIRAWVKQVIETLGYRVGRGSGLARPTIGRQVVRLAKSMIDRQIVRQNIGQDKIERYVLRQILRKVGHKQDQVQKWVKKAKEAVAQRQEKDIKGIGQEGVFLVSHNMGGGFMDKLPRIRHWIRQFKQEPMCLALQETWLQQEQVTQGESKSSSAL